ncbi:alpha/beta hydrolase [Clostridium sp. D2Q-11]|uniref:Alpha/beta hydrolase n=1 Tax=Anaeromonas frigoriresistens TaxID=2683708 RepID=A0A942UWW2_9FIRM|nr:alpha/beta hydrolase [Anaeromonas frigoriresistens]MBS4538391.1 alpha/beta hydrolase [Anaeromonas frigoriresistens]
MDNRKINANGVELEVNHYPKEGDTIIFLHFSGGNLAQWSGIIPYFKDDYNIVTMDIRGHGKSEKLKEGYTLDNMAKDVIGVMDELDLSKAHIVGSSLGGEIGVNLSANYPDRIVSVVAEGAIQNFFGKNGSYDIPEEEIPNKKEEIRKERKERITPVYNSIEEKVETKRKDFEEGGIEWDSHIEKFEKYDTVETEDGKFTTSCPKWVVDNYVENYWDIKFEKYFKKTKCPVLMIPSEDEWSTPEVKESIENYQKLLKKSKVDIIPGGFHAYVAFQYPRKFSEVIREFYKGL